jgi:hypothetical protein
MRANPSWMEFSERTAFSSLLIWCMLRFLGV